MSIKQLEVAAPSGRGLTDLSIIGVPFSQHDKMPSVLGFPKKFSPDALPVWTKMVQDPSFQYRMKGYVTLDLMWHNAIQEFLSRCNAAGVSPFVSNADVTKNEFLLDYLRRARIELVKFIDASGLFERVKVRKAYREYQRKPNGMTIVTWAELYPVKDDGFRDWLQQSPMPRFVKMTEGRYRRVIRPGIEAWVKYINMHRVVVSLTIETTGIVTVPNKSRPTRKEVDQFIDDFLYLPTIRAHRFKAVRTRLF